MAIPEIDVAELASRLAAGSQVVDVRQPDEYVEVHVPGAILIPLAEVPDRLGDLPHGELLIICRSGGRSLRAAEFLVAQGRPSVNVAGGTLAWVAAGFPVATGPEPG